MSNIRSKGREMALQILYQSEWGTFEDIEEAIEEYLNGLGPEKVSLNHPSVKFAKKQLKGVLEHKDELDKIIQKFLKGWKLNRLASVDRNILRLGLYELLKCSDIPAKVAINEAVELAKKFGSDESSSFVNGVLDAAYKSLVQEKKKEAKAL